MKEFIGLLLIVVGVLLGAYVGGWLMFIGGIVGIIEAIRNTTLIPMDVAVNVAKIVFSGFVGQFIFLFFSALGTATIKA